MPTIQAEQFPPNSQPGQIAMDRSLVKFLLTASFVSLVTAGLALEPQGKPTFIVQAADGKARQGALQQLGKDWSVQFDGQAVAAGDLVSLRRVDLPLPPLPEEAHLILVNGDRIPMEAPRLVGERLHFRHPYMADGKEAEIALSAVAVLWFESVAGSEDGEVLRRRLGREPRKRDQVLLTNDDAAEGVLNALDGKTVEIEANKKISRIDLKQAAAIALSSELANPLKMTDVHAHAVLTGGKAHGTRITLASATSDGIILQGTTVFGASLKMPLAKLALLDVLGGKAVYLADLKPSRYEHFPFLDTSWPLTLDGNVLGRDLRVGASTYARGLGVHAHSRVTYRLDGAYRRLEALVGLDARSGRQGSASIAVIADGKPLDLGGPTDLSERRPFLAIQVSVAGVKELVLKTDYGERGDVQAHVNWVDARLVK